ncbi:NAD(P)-dependent dehydrogenase (short-subunit alcohol dehydrogenase family) [Novosphingobium kunmingense]|uniref:NAD(P)-dependent dehydrogenase (Short-subunit alcohol dehydrogenase family) n=1 Tax=Novosphingobium kunmingense TaxID=1211806 RepID=A0A2N0I152_9SPHN|nr:SDR family oxidoreductase [Novosphingobium kunmingense]PKB24918.1 NAD(P)-dependent dehydrogenase (short-subunit alcohol dehydrogenase family) [Novosphingobium kunmingense]
MPPAVLITGSGRRIGAQLARRFGAAGWHVVIHVGHNPEAAKAFAATLPSAEVVQCDLLDGEAALAMIENLAARLDDWRMLINCAAVFHLDTAQDLDPAVFAEAMRVNAETPARISQAFLGQARATSGRRLIQFLDQKLLNPNPDFFSYTMAKHAFAATVKMLAMAQADPRDRVYGLAPGAMLPSFDQASEEHETSGRMNLLQRLTDPDELADAAQFLAEGWLASGETLIVDSGQHLLSQPRDVLFLARE